MDRVILAFTGGLQSSVCLHWLRDRGHTVKAVVLEIGQTSPSWELGEYALSIGAQSAHVEDCREEFCREYAFRALRASAIYERRYLLSGALARPLVAAVVTRMARDEGWHHVALGAGKLSNDLARFQANAAALAPELQIVSPDEVPPLKSREAALQYAEQHGIVPQESGVPRLNYDANLWGACVAADPQFGTWESLPPEMFSLTTPPAHAPAEPQQIIVEFQKGSPVAVDGERLPPHTLVKRMNEIAGRHGVGRVELVEDRLAGMKAREAYEAPGATALMEAHSALEELTLYYETLQVKQDVARRYARMIYAGQWFSSARVALDALVESTQQHVSGEVRLELFRGRAYAVGRRSAYSLLNGDVPSVYREDEWRAATSDTSRWRHSRRAAREQTESGPR